jgi:hypothetical protein
MSYGPPPTDEDEARMQAFSDAVDDLADIEPSPWWRRLLHYPAFVALAGAQVVRARWDEWAKDKRQREIVAAGVGALLRFLFFVGVVIYVLGAR